jgi:hypothetical protein
MLFRGRTKAFRVKRDAKKGRKARQKIHSKARKSSWLWVTERALPTACHLLPPSHVDLKMSKSVFGRKDAARLARRKER